MQLGVVVATEETKIVDCGLAALGPWDDVVGIGPERGDRVSTVPFLRPAPPNRTCGFRRIRLSTGSCR
ncbi:hypothetical protein BH23ACT5_BH23ACT5_12310 [soil metagenome]